MILLRAHELLRVGIELVQAFARTEPVLATLVFLRVASIRGNLHAAYRIFRRSSGAGSYPLLPFVMMAMNHVRATAKPHHEIEECREQEK
jgi:hypothetical protein